MLIDESLLRRDIIIVDDTATGETALAAAGGAAYIVIRFADGRWAVIEPAVLHQKLQVYRMMASPLHDLPAKAFEPHLVGAVHRESTDPRDQAFVENLGERELLILLEGDKVSGLLVGAVRYRRAAPPPPPAPSPPGISFGVDATTGTLSGSEQAAEGPQPRFINVEVKDAENEPHNPKMKPLETGKLYKLIFGVDIERHGIFSDSFKYQFREGEDRAVITVRLETEDFTILDEEEQKLYVPRSGPSKNKVNFPIEPKHDGECLINAVFLKDGNFIQVMTLRFMVGALFSAETLGRGVEAAFTVQPRDVSLTIINTGAGFQLIMITPGTAATATLPIKLPELKDIAAEARSKLLDVVYAEKDGVRYFQQMITIPADIGLAALQHMAQAGFLLYQRIFFGPSADDQSRLLGRKLRELAKKERLNIQIFSQDFVLPWAVLYLADRFDPENIQPELFLGFKHVIEHIPLQPRMLVMDNRVSTGSGFNVSLNVNTDIDREMRATLVADQLGYWDKLLADGVKFNLVKRTTAREVTDALANPSTPDHVLYFYCHGVSQDVDEKGGVDRSALLFSNKGRLTLEDLKLYAPAMNPEDILANAPLVFINACESAQLSPLIYDGFVPYFMSKGARGVIGTECETPALFAIEWARRFFDHFLKGETLGEIFLNLRQEFFNQHNNPLGLLYSLYVDADTRVEPALE